MLHYGRSGADASLCGRHVSKANLRESRATASPHSGLQHQVYIPIVDYNTRYIPIVDYNTRYVPIVDYNTRYIPIVDHNSQCQVSLYV